MGTDGVRSMEFLSCLILSVSYFHIPIITCFTSVQEECNNHLYDYGMPVLSMHYCHKRQRGFISALHVYAAKLEGAYLNKITLVTYTSLILP
jgi:hypothetical protein